MAPPQHGKSTAVRDFITWVLGKNPDLSIIFASYSDELGLGTNRDLQRIMASKCYQRIFPKVLIGAPGWPCNTNYFEIPHHEGSFRNTTVMSAVTGFGFHLGIIDDPVKGRHEANSKAIRDRTWDWYTDDFSPRSAANGGRLIIMTAGTRTTYWALDKEENWQALRYPAIAIEVPRVQAARLPRGAAQTPEHRSALSAKPHRGRRLDPADREDAGAAAP
jgi:hypothetical protein